MLIQITMYTEQEKSRGEKVKTSHWEKNSRLLTLIYYKLPRVLEKSQNKDVKSFGL